MRIKKHNPLKETISAQRVFSGIGGDYFYNIPINCAGLKQKNMKKELKKPFIEQLLGPSKEINEPPSQEQAKGIGLNYN